jgi:hypothetical protein
MGDSFLMQRNRLFRFASLANARHAVKGMTKAVKDTGSGDKGAELVPGRPQAALELYFVKTYRRAKKLNSRNGQRACASCMSLYRCWYSNQAESFRNFSGITVEISRHTCALATALETSV